MPHCRLGRLGVEPRGLLIMTNDEARALTAFTTSQKTLRNKLASATIGRTEFARKIKRCSLDSCRGMCCYDGASVDAATATKIQKVSDQHRPRFSSMGLSLPDVVIEKNEWNGVVGFRTAVRPFTFRSQVENFPEHFNETACVFLLDDGRCGLQVLSEQDGKHPWFYKPFTCWLQPIKLTDDAIRLYDEESDPNKLPNYDGFVIRTCCGRNEPNGRPAAEVLREELEFLSKLLDRDLLAELATKSLDDSEPTEPSADGNQASG
jgi:hypothetical protein